MIGSSSKINFVTFALGQASLRLLHHCMIFCSVRVEEEFIQNLVLFFPWSLFFQVTSFFFLSSYLVALISVLYICSSKAYNIYQLNFSTLSHATIVVHPQEKGQTWETPCHRSFSKILTAIQIYQIFLRHYEVLFCIIFTVLTCYLLDNFTGKGLLHDTRSHNLGAFAQNFFFFLKECDIFPHKLYRK